MPGWIKDYIELSFLGLSVTQRREVLFGLALSGLLLYAGWGFLEFARNSQVDEIKIELVRIEEASVNAAEAAKALAKHLSSQNLEATGLLRAEIMESQMYNRRIFQCKATDPSLRQAYALQIQNDQSRYHRLVGRYYPLPDCSDL